MSRYAAFLRAINVGGRVVKMDVLRRLFETLDLAEVETVIASGNVLFASSSKSAKALEKAIEKCLHDKLGYAVETFVRTPAEMTAVAAYQPFAARELAAPGNVLYVGFLDDEPTAAAKKRVLALATDVDAFHLHGRELYWLLRTKFSESKITGNKLERTLEMPTTLRNVTTVRKIAAKLALALALLAAPLAVRSQTPPSEQPPGVAPAYATAEDVVRELYRLVTIEKGQETDWEQVRQLFLPQAVIVLRVSKDASQVFDVQGWIDDFKAWNEKAKVKETGFSEKIVTMKPRVFRDIANVFVLYEASITGATRPPTRGVDSIELVKKDGRWWIAAITNDIVNADNPAPAELRE
ncbi:MAG TPA: DUF1697 domain-containing protein [Candidatus Krumholzibacteria bacterium]|nr:DUF1697 domain-containing protein [Candidatus Krumholzibacteria bacterium]